MSYCYSLNKQHRPSYRSSHKRASRRQIAGRKSKISGGRINSDQHPDGGGEWYGDFRLALVTPRKCSKEHSNLDYPTEFCDILLAI